MRYPHKTYSRSFQIYQLWGAFSKRQKRTKMYALFRKVSYALPYSLSQNSGLIFPKAQHNIFVHTIKVFSPCTLPRGRILFNAFSHRPHLTIKHGLRLTSPYTNAFSKRSLLTRLHYLNNALLKNAHLLQTAFEIIRFHRRFRTVLVRAKGENQEIISYENA